MAAKNEHEKQRTKKGLGFALWLLAAVVLLILFVVNQGRIFSNLKATGFFDRVFGKTPAFVENAEITSSEAVLEKNDVDPEPESGTGMSFLPSGATGIISQNEAATALQENRGEQKNQSIEEGEVIPEELPATALTALTEDAAVHAGKTMNLKLFFMTINSGGSVSRKEVTRQMKKTESPLSDAVNALIAGPDITETAQGCRTLVSNGTTLLGASVKDGVATLNFSDEFEFNQYGIEGLRGQLQQIVFTATAFPTVQSVQFLISGEKKDYLGSEGVWIGTPLNRNSF